MLSVMGWFRLPPPTPTTLYDAGPFIIKRVDVFLRAGRGIYSSMSGLWLPLVP